MLGMGNKKTETQKDVAGVRTRSMSKKGSVAIAALAADVEMDRRKEDRKNEAAKQRETKKAVYAFP